MSGKMNMFDMKMSDWFQNEIVDTGDMLVPYGSKIDTVALINKPNNTQDLVANITKELISSS